MTPKKRTNEAPERPERAELRAIAQQLGRALALTIVAAQCGPRTEDHAIEAADRAWGKLADLVTDFAEGTA